MNLFRIPIAGWRKCVHEAASFESRGEYAAAGVLDVSAVVVWWLRNDPAFLRISTPVGNFEPDFVYLANYGGVERHGILEIKGGIFWDGEGSEARIKSDAAIRWIEAVNSLGGKKWQYATVLDSDAILAGSLEELLRNALAAQPAP